MDTAETVTVVIPARNEELFIEDCLESILRQQYERMQVLVLDGDSTDATAEVVRSVMARDDRVQLERNPGRTAASALNVALAHARGRWLVRVDAHSVIPPDYVALAVEHLREQRWGGVGGRKDAVGRTPAGRAIAVALGSRFGVGDSTYHHGVAPQPVDHVPFGCYPTELARQLGGWNEDVLANQDYEFDYRLRRAGHQLLFDPRLVILWHCRQSIPDHYRQYRRYGIGKSHVALLHPRSLRPRHLAAPAFVAYLAVAALGAWRRPARSAALVAPYALAVAVASARAGSRLETRQERALLPAAFVAMHVGWGVGFWTGLGRQLRARTGSRLQAPQRPASRSSTGVA